MNKIHLSLLVVLRRRKLVRTPTKLPPLVFIEALAVLVEADSVLTADLVLSLTDIADCAVPALVEFEIRVHVRPAQRTTEDRSLRHRYCLLLRRRVS